ncbi:hypothetical protein JD844_025028 [Phrynosoma platyrhinos]|uniref:Transmembrane protein 63B n=1 Tax=Phrynosoma platyrhinos TaxID=52577 RepID=A0ABQ7SZW4_PHRPL|nr:hypothetical protein JD844_025028 [Phrynosoma platyrhinos]
MLPFVFVALGAVETTCRSSSCSNNSTKDYCYSARIRSTVLQGLPFGGVPTVLALDFMCFLALLFVFSILRKVAWDYGRLALVTDADRQVKLSLQRRWQQEREEREYVASALHSDSHDRYERLTSVSSSVDFDQRDNGFCSWLTAIFRIKDDEIRDKCGADAVHYLSFQRHIIGLLVAVENNPYSFGRTTIANLNSGSETSYPTVKRTLFINGISKYAEPEKIKKHFEEAYTNCTVLEARPCYDVARLMFLDAERKKAERGKIYFTNLQTKENISSMINPKPCGHLCCCAIKGCEEVEAIEYYTKLEEKLKEDYKKEKEKVNEKPLGMAFVTFHNEAITAIILKDFNVCKCQGCKCRGEPRASSCSESLHVSNWTVSYAPDPQNIYWEHLSIRGFIWWFRCLIINVVLFILLFFLTTPAIIITTMDKFNVTKPVEYLNAHWTRSGENRTTMHKCYTFLIFMVLLLPSLGLSSLDVFFRWLFDKKFLAEAAVRFECVFLPDNGAFFVNYVIASAFIGNAMDLLRIPGLLMYMIRLCLARSAAERRNVKRHQAYEFQFGAAYAWMMCVFTVVMTYSITCPIIVPFGLMYMLLKHLVDRYNLYYAYLPAKLDKKIHSGAVNQVVAAPILCLFWLLFFSTVRTEWDGIGQLAVSLVLCHTFVFQIDHTEVDVVDGRGNGRPTTNHPPAPKSAQKYIAQVLQDSSPEGDAAESEEQGSQDEELINPNGINDTDFQSCEDSLIENEIHH